MLLRARKCARALAGRTPLPPTHAAGGQPRLSAPPGSAAAFKNMVLNEIGAKISGALFKFAKTRFLTNAAVEELVVDVSQALEESDVPAGILQKMRADITASLAGDEYLNRILAGEDKGGTHAAHQLVQNYIVRAVVKILSPETKPYALVRGRTNIVMFVGLQGAGKTTTCTKYALYHKTRGWKVGIVCCDTFRAGAFDQLKQNCTAAKIPFYGSYTEKDPARIAVDGTKHFADLRFDLVVLDTSGRHSQEAALFQEMSIIDRSVQPNERIFVMDSSIGQAAADQAAAFRRTVDIGSVILTKLDGHTKGGGALAAVSATNAPISFIGLGEKFADFEVFDAARFVSKLLGHGDVQGLFEAVQNAHIDPREQMETMVKMMKGQFTFFDFRNQLRNIQKMGPVEKIVEMVPWMSAVADQVGMEDLHSMKMWGHIMDSMHKAELVSNPKRLQEQSREQSRERGGGGNSSGGSGEKPGRRATRRELAGRGLAQGRDEYHSRLRRLAVGAGFTTQQVQEFFDHSKEFSDMITKIGKPGGMQQMMSKMGVSQDLIRQMMGGMGGMLNNPAAMAQAQQMAASMGMKLPAGADMSKMMQQMGGGAPVGAPGGINMGQVKQLKKLLKPPK